MAAHDFADGGGVGWGPGRGGSQDASDLAEVAGPEEAGGDDGEGFCRGGVKVFEAVNGSARDAAPSKKKCAVGFPRVSKQVG